MKSCNQLPPRETNRQKDKQIERKTDRGGPLCHRSHHRRRDTSASGRVDRRSRVGGGTQQSPFANVVLSLVFVLRLVIVCLSVCLSVCLHSNCSSHGNSVARFEQVWFQIGSLGKHSTCVVSSPALFVVRGPSIHDVHTRARPNIGCG